MNIINGKTLRDIQLPNGDDVPAGSDCIIIDKRHGAVNIMTLAGPVWVPKSAVRDLESLKKNSDPSMNSMR